MNKESYKKEIKLCKKLSLENGGKCNWGVCKNCGVIPLLYKLHKRKLLENLDDINKLKNKIISC